MRRYSKLISPSRSRSERVEGSGRCGIVDCVDSNRDPVDLVVTMEPLADLLGDADRGTVLGDDHADDAWQAKRHKGPVAHGRRGLGREALPPVLAREGPGKLGSGPGVRLVEAHAAEKRAR